MSVNKTEPLFTIEFSEETGEKLNGRDRAILNLWLKVMALAINDVIRGLRIQKLTHLESLPKPKQLFNLNASQGLAWITSDANYPGSFVFLCYLINSDPDSIRNRILPCARDTEFDFFTRMTF